MAGVQESGLMIRGGKNPKIRPYGRLLLDCAGRPKNVILAAVVTARAWSKLPMRWSVESQLKRGGR